MEMPPDFIFDFEAARERIDSAVRATPTVDVTLEGRRMYLKLEYLQVGGSFKFRGAFNALASMGPEVDTVIAASGGNHGIAVAAAAQAMGVQAIIVVPETAPAAKVDAIVRRGATVHKVGTKYSQAAEHAANLVRTHGWATIHAYDDRSMIEGHGTIVGEVMTQAPVVEALVCSIGGGGLISGVALAAASSGIRVIGVEPYGVPTMRRARDAGMPVDVGIDSVAASALGATRVADITFAISQRHVKDLLLVDDSSILRAQRLLWDELRIAVEPAAAITVAAILDGQIAAERPCAILCGANDVSQLFD